MLIGFFLGNLPEAQRKDITKEHVCQGISERSPECSPLLVPTKQMLTPAHTGLPPQSSSGCFGTQAPTFVSVQLTPSATCGTTSRLWPLWGSILSFGLLESWNLNSAVRHRHPHHPWHPCQLGLAVHRPTLLLSLGVAVAPSSSVTRL